jgi:glycogenin
MPLSLFDATSNMLWQTIYRLLPVERVANPKPANLFLMGRPDLLYAFTKLALWKQTEYSKVVYLDADIVVLQNLDHLFDIDVVFAAAPDIGWPDAFNTGLMALSPSMSDYWALMALAQSGDSFDGADQGLLNQYYQHKNWHRLSFTYNCTPSAEYQWEPAYRYHKSNIKAVHFIGKDKPWTKGRQSYGGDGVYGELVGKWWSVYDSHYKQVSIDSGRNFALTSIVVRVRTRCIVRSIDCRPKPGSWRSCGYVLWAST